VLCEKLSRFSLIPVDRPFSSGLSQGVSGTFGFSAAVSGKTVVVGAPGASSQAGAAYIYKA
jgi:hypothetical protein